MNRKTLIVTLPWDISAHQVHACLKRLGHDSILYYCTDFTSKIEQSLYFSNKSQRSQLKIGRTAIDTKDIGAVWWRRAMEPQVVSFLKGKDSQFALYEAEIMNNAFFHLFPKETFWVSHFRSQRLADQKPVQVSAAIQCGLEIPRTLFSNSPSAIREFLKKNKRASIYKTFWPISWVNKNGETEAVFTTKISQKMLPDATSLRAVPGIYQELADKSYDLRLFLFGKESIAVKIQAKNTEFAATYDWRFDNHQNTIFEVTEIPKAILLKSQKLLKALNLSYGSLDFVVSNKGKYCFLEVNTHGQFLWLESVTGAPVLEPFSRFLISGDQKFVCPKNLKGITLASVQKDVSKVINLNKKKYKSQWPKGNQ